MRLDPLSLIISTVAAGHYQASQQNEKALRQIHKTLEMDPAFLPAHYYAYMSYFIQGMMDEAFKHFLETYSGDYNLTDQEAANLKNAFADSGWEGVIPFMIQRHEALAHERFMTPADLSKFNIILGNHSLALDIWKARTRITML